MTDPIDVQKPRRRFALRPGGLEGLGVLDEDSYVPPVPSHFTFESQADGDTMWFREELYRWEKGERDTFPQNPGWVVALLEQAQASWDVPSDWIPDPDAPALGCGYYGCALRTPIDGAILKFTSDESEAAFAALTLRRGGVPQDIGLVRYFGVYEIPGATFRGGQIYALWREETPRTLLDARDTYSAPGADTHALQAYKQLGDELYRMVDNIPADVAFQRLAAAQEHLDMWGEAWDTSHQEPVLDAFARNRLAMGRAGDVINAARMQLANPDPGVAMATLLEGLIFCEEHLMTGALGMGPIGAALDYARIDLEVILTDVHLGNVGLREQTEYGETFEVPIIFDPGNVLPLVPGVYDDAVVPPMPGLD